MAACLMTGIWVMPRSISIYLVCGSIKKAGSKQSGLCFLASWPLAKLTAAISANRMRADERGGAPVVITKTSMPAPTAIKSIIIANTMTEIMMMAGIAAKDHLTMKATMLPKPIEVVTVTR